MIFYIISKLVSVQFHGALDNIVFMQLYELKNRVNMMADLFPCSRQLSNVGNFEDFLFFKKNRVMGVWVEEGRGEK